MVPRVDTLRCCRRIVTRIPPIGVAVQTSVLPPSVLEFRERMGRRLLDCGREKLSSMWNKTYTNTLETTVQYVSDGSVYVITGDIAHMWLRDSAAQVSHYIPLAREDVQVQLLIEGVIRRQMHFISHDPYSNSFSFPCKVSRNAFFPSPLRLNSATHIFVGEPWSSKHSHEKGWLCGHWVRTGFGWDCVAALNYRLTG